MKVCDKCGKEGIGVEDCGSNDFQVTTELLILQELDEEGVRCDLLTQRADLCPDCHEILFASIEKMWSDFVPAKSAVS